MDPVVRRAELADSAELARLEALGRASLVDVRGGNLRLAECPLVGDWSTLPTDDDRHVYVATWLDAVVGYLVIEFPQSRERGIITHVFVEEPARELGLGDALVEQAVDDVRRRGLAGIEATALPGDRETKNLFERAGLTARRITVYKSLI